MTKATTLSTTRAAAGLDAAAVAEHCRVLRMPTVSAQFDRLAQEAAQTNQTHTSYLAVLLGAEVEERERGMIARRLQEAKFPRLDAGPVRLCRRPAPAGDAAARTGRWQLSERAEPVIFIGDSGTGKTHLATGLGVAACQQKQRVRFVTAAGLVNELVEAQHHNLLGRALARWSRYD